MVRGTRYEKKGICGRREPTLQYEYLFKDKITTIRLIFIKVYINYLCTGCFITVLYAK